MMTKKSLIQVMLLVTTVLLISSCVQQQKPQIPSIPSQTTTVIIKNFAFEPQELTIKKGNTVTWINKDSAPHTATSEGNFDSKTLNKDESFSYTFENTGTFNYICTIHPSMKGVIIVE